MRAPISGKILYMGVEEGEHVDSGSILALLDTSYLSLQIKVLQKKKEALLDKEKNMQLRLDMLRKKLEREKVLVETGTAGKYKIEDLKDEIRLLRSEMNVLKASIGEVDARIENLKKKMADLFLRAPVSGEVIDILSDRGVFVPAGSPIIKMCNMDEIYVEALFREKFLPKIRRGVRVELSGPEESVVGTVVSIKNEVYYDVYEDQTYVIVKIIPDSIPGMWRIKDFQLTARLEQ